MVEVQTWEALALSVTVLIAVLGAYGALIKWNYDVARALKLRLLGKDGDDTYDGFLSETEQRFDQLENKVDTHAEQTHEQLYSVDKKINLLIHSVDDELDTSGVDDVPPPSGRGFLRGTDHFPDGGRPEPEDPGSLSDGTEGEDEADSDEGGDGP